MHFEIVMLADRMIEFVQWHHHYRVVWTDGRPLPKMDEIELKWNGYFVGRWDGTKDWDPQIYCVPSEEFKFNKLIRDGGVGKAGAEGAK